MNLRGEDGSVILKRRVSTQWEEVPAFFADLAEKARSKGERLESDHADLPDAAHKLVRRLASD